MIGYMERVAAVLAVVEVGSPPPAVAYILRAVGVDCVCEGARIVLVDGLLLLERGEAGAWSGRSLQPGEEDAPPLTGQDLADALGWAVPMPVMGVGR
jgi:hypothetical protein